MSYTAHEFDSFNEAQAWLAKSQLPLLSTPTEDLDDLHSRCHKVSGFEHETGIVLFVDRS